MRRLEAVVSVAMVLLIPLFVFNGSPVSAEKPSVIILYPVEGETYRGSEAIVLNASDSYDPKGEAITISWKDSIDGPLGYGAVLDVHLTVGAHVITCTVTNDDKETNSSTRHVTVLALVPPVAKLETDKSVARVFEIITFSGAKSYDPDYAVTDFYFNFGDGYNTTWLSSNTVTHQYVAPGSYTVMLKVKDNDGLTNSMNLTVTIEAKPTVDDNTTRSNIYIVALIAILVIIIIVVLVVWNRIRVRSRREEEQELIRKLRNPRAYRPSPGPQEGVRRMPPEGGQARKVRLPASRAGPYDQDGPRKVRAPVQGKDRQP